MPFASAHALFSLSQLAVWWLRLGIGIEPIKPRHPQQNGRHERMHLTLKKEATKPPAANFLQQQARFDKFIEIFNHQRPHEALDMKYPAEVYQPSPRPYTRLPDLDYPFHHKPIVVTRCGRICLGNKKINFSRSLPDRRSASKKCTTTSDWLALCTMIWGISIWRPQCWNRCKIPSVQKCYPCSRYILLPMSPGRTVLTPTVKPAD